MPATSVSSVPKQLKYEQEKLDDVQVNIQSSLSHNRSGICARVNCKRFHMQHQQRREITLILLFAAGCTTRVEKGLVPKYAHSSHFAKDFSASLRNMT